MNGGSDRIGRLWENRFGTTGTTSCISQGQGLKRRTEELSWPTIAVSERKDTQQEIWCVCVCVFYERKGLQQYIEAERNAHEAHVRALHVSKLECGPISRVGHTVAVEQNWILIRAVNLVVDGAEVNQWAIHHLLKGQQLEWYQCHFLRGNL